LKLQERGWRVLVVWECETKDKASLAEKINHFLETAMSNETARGGAN
jgi:G:T-mismatch repair DNA endonuclease (very short patch repair protein)